MAEKQVKVQNVSRSDFYLNLGFVTPGKLLPMKPDTIVLLDADEYMYLSTQCRGAFEKGFLKVVEKDEKLNADIIESKNVMSNDDITKMLELPIAKFRTALNKIDSDVLLRDIRSAAVEMNKTDKYITEIDKAIEKNADGSILL